MTPDPMDDDAPSALVNPYFWLAVFGFWSFVLAVGWLLAEGVMQ